MNKETTRHLEDRLKKMRGQDEVSEFLQANGETENSFGEYFSRYISEKGIDVPEILKRSGVSRNYIYNILNGDRDPGRDKVLALCVAAGMTYMETDRALELAGERRIYPKDERDARIAIMINQGVQNVTEVNIMLDKYNLDLLK